MANLLVQKTLIQLVDAVEADLADSTNVHITAAEVQNCVAIAIRDMSRVIPQQKVYEYTLSFTITDETFAAAYGTAVSLANNPIEKGTEVVHSIAGGGTTYTRDTDYTMDYSNGTITVLSTGAIADLATVYINYTKSKLMVDLAVITDLIRVVHVEYPVGNVPMSLAGFSIWGNLLRVDSYEGSSQQKMGDAEHLAVYYEAEQNIATT